LYYSDGVEQLGAELAREHVRSVSAIWWVWLCICSLSWSFWNPVAYRFYAFDVFDPINGEHKHSFWLCCLWVATSHVISDR
jgi:hypothetical protein